MFETGLFRWSLPVLLVGLHAQAQSEALLEAVRVQRAGVAAQARGELERCLAARCPDQPALGLLTGLLELSEGHPAQAMERLRGVRPPKGLEAFHGWYLGEAEAWAGQPRAALKTLTRARRGAPATLSTRIDRRLAELHLEVGEPGKALKLLDADGEVAGSPELLFTRALARTAARQLAPARADLKTLALRFPAHAHGVEARARLEAEGAWRPTFEEQLARAQALFTAGDVSTCLAELAALEAPKGSQAKVALLTGQALLARGREQDEAAQQQLALAATGPPSIAAQALSVSAKRLMRRSDNAAARATFKKLDETYPNEPASDEAGYLAAWLAMNSGDFKTAVADFAAFEERHPGSRRRDEARWFRAFSLLRAGDSAASRAVLQSLVADFPKTSLLPQALYWAARAAQLAGAGTDAGPSVDVVAEYRAVLTAFPGTFYGLLASERLQERSVEAPLPFAVTPRQLEVKRPPALDLAALLARTGLFRDAALEVSRAVGAVGASDALTWGHALQALGEYGAAHTLAARYLWGAVYGQRTPEALALMYPRAFQGSVESWTGQHGIEPALAWAIMRRESAFAPEVTSSADARGLMQLIPPTAHGIARELKLPPTDATELYSPEWNIHLATWYLRALQDRLHHPTLVAAAYNGGPAPVAKWAAERQELPLDQWVEEIPYKETRAYVKQVTADLFIYRQLYGGPEERLSLAVPRPGEGVNF